MGGDEFRGHRAPDSTRKPALKKAADWNQAAIEAGRVQPVGERCRFSKCGHGVLSGDGFDASRRCSRRPTGGCTPSSKSMQRKQRPQNTQAPRRFGEINPGEIKSGSSKCWVKMNLGKTGYESTNWRACVGSGGDSLPWRLFSATLVRLAPGFDVDDEQQIGSSLERRSVQALRAARGRSTTYSSFISPT